MPKEHPIKTRIKEHIKVKEAELAGVDAKIDELRSKEAELMVRRIAIVEGIDSDKALLVDSEPKIPRVRKIKTLGQQMGTAAKEGDV